MTGLIGFSSGYYAMLDCDALLVLGADFPYRQFYPEARRRVAQVDIRGEQIGRRRAVEWRWSATFVPRSGAAATARRRHDDAHLARARKHYEQARKELDGWPRANRAETLIHPQQVAKAISDLAAPDAVFTCDVGLPTVWAARYLATSAERRLLGSFWHGSMANAMARRSAPRRATRAAKSSLYRAMADLPC